MKKIEITIGPRGEVTIHVVGTQGLSCTDLTAGLVGALGGKVDSQEYTLEAYQEPAAEADAWATLRDQAGLGGK